MNDPVGLKFGRDSIPFPSEGLVEESEHSEIAIRLRAAGNRLTEMRRRLTDQSFDAAHTLNAVLTQFDSQLRNGSSALLSKTADETAELTSVRSGIDAVQARLKAISLAGLPMESRLSELVRIGLSLGVSCTHIVKLASSSLQTQCELLPALREMAQRLTAVTTEAEFLCKRQQQTALHLMTIRSVHEGLLHGNLPTLERLEALALEIITESEKGAAPGWFDVEGFHPERWLAIHSRNTAAIVAFLAGQDERWRPYRVQLAAAALVQDAGMSQIPAANELSSTGPLTEETRSTLERHPLQAGVALESIPGFPEEFAKAVAKHHERLDGSGYPARVADAEVDSTSRLLAVADVYAALRSPRPHRGAMSPHKALSEVLRLADAGQLDSAWARGLLNLSFYATGTIVELSTGETAEVVAPQEARSQPYLATLPIVRILTDNVGAPKNPIVYRNLAHRPECRIVRQIA